MRRACLSVCLSARVSQGTTSPKFTKFSADVIYGLGSVLLWQRWDAFCTSGFVDVKRKGSPHSITKCRVPELIPVLGSQPTGDVSHKPSDGLPLLSARPAVTIATLKRAATSFAAWGTEA